MSLVSNLRICQNMVEIAEYAQDVYRFATAYSSSMASTPHLYISALSWLPTHSRLLALLPARLPLPLISEGRQGDWDSCLWTQRLREKVDKLNIIKGTRHLFAMSEVEACILDADSGKVVWKLFIDRKSVV